MSLKILIWFGIVTDVTRAGDTDDSFLEVSNLKLKTVLNHNRDDKKVFYLVAQKRTPQRVSTFRLILSPSIGSLGQLVRLTLAMVTIVAFQVLDGDSFVGSRVIEVISRLVRPVIRRPLPLG